MFCCLALDQENLMEMTEGSQNLSALENKMSCFQRVHGFVDLKLSDRKRA